MINWITLFWIIAVVLIFMAIVGWYQILKEKADCERRGGFMVKSVFEYVCVNTDR